LIDAMDSAALSLGQRFELERMNRAIDAEMDPSAVRGIAKQLLQAWQSQRAASRWLLSQQSDVQS
jgi:hypothetical protein